MPDLELANWRSGISITLGANDGADKGTAYMEEYLYWDKTVTDKRVIYIRSDTPISFAHNAFNKLSVGPNGVDQPIGADGLDNTPNSGDEGVIRYMVDRDGSDVHRWNDTGYTNGVIPAPSFLLPAYTTPLTFDTLTYPIAGGSAGPVLGAVTPYGSGTSFFQRGYLDAFGDEWHQVTVGDDDKLVMPNQKAEQQASDGKIFLFVVNPKTPALTVRASGDAQFYTTPPKAYDVAKIHAQTTYLTKGSGAVSFELRDIFARNISYRINGGSWVAVGAATVTLTDADFTDGTNTLEYRSAGFEANAKTRTVVKNPDHPSKAEPHGNYLWMTADELTRIRGRLHPTPRVPYTSAFNDLLNNDDVNMQRSWDANGLTSARRPFFYTTPTFYGFHQSVGGAALPNAFVAAIKGWTFTRSGKTKSYGQYGKEMLLHNVWSRVDPIRFQGNQATGPNPATEVIGAGYYMVNTHFDALPAYDIMVGHFRSDQVTGGITPIEDYYIRDSLAHHACLMGKAITGGFGAQPGLWGTARIAGALMWATVMPEYSSPVYGVSGYGLNQTPFPWTPDPAYALTHKTMWGITKYTNATIPGTALPVFDPEENALWRAGGIWGGPNIGYFNLLSDSMAILTNINRRYNPSVSYPVLEQGLAHSIAGTLFTTSSKATASFGSGSSALTFTAQAVGAAGLAIGVTITNPGTPNSSLSVGVSGNEITILLATNSSSAVTSTAAQVKAACDAFAPCLALVTTAISSGGAGVVSAAARKALMGTYSAQTLLGNAWCGSLGTACVTDLKARNNESGAIRSSRTLGIVWYDDELVSVAPTAPTITSHPANLSVTTGQPASFSVSVTGSVPLSYQWRKDGVDIPGATASTYTIASTVSGSAGAYTVYVSNSAGSATSNAASLTVNAPSTTAPTITQHPATPINITAPASVSFSVTATGTAPLSYQWRKNGANIVGATSATYSITSTVEADSGSYTCVVTNSAGNATSNAAVLTVAPYVAPPPTTLEWVRRRLKGL